jgi:Zn-dependent protease with chaperone function
MKNLYLEKRLSDVQSNKKVLKESYLKTVWFLFRYELFQFILLAVNIYLSSSFSVVWSNKLSKLLKQDWKVFVMPLDMMNACSFGIGIKHVFITSGLIKKLNEREVMAVLLHEVHHSIKYDIVSRFAVGSFGGGAILHFIKNTMERIPDKLLWGPGLFICTFIALLAFTLGSMWLNSVMVGRRQEIKADQYTVQFGYGKDAISALTKITKVANKECNKTNVCKYAMKILSVVDEHPPLATRVERILDKMEELKPSNVKNLFIDIKMMLDNDNMSEEK